MKTLFRVVMVMSLGFIAQESYSLSKEIRDKGFVYLHEIDPTILVSLRYLTDENFVGEPIDGYKKSVVIMTRQAAEALKQVQAAVKKDGYCLVVYDAYRPQQAVDHFMRWSGACSNCVDKKEYYYPYVNKADVFDLGYVAQRSGHSRGSTVDITLIKDGDTVHPIVIRNRVFLDGTSILVLDDGTLDMGSSFDLCDELSHGDSYLIDDKYRKRRTYLKNVMDEYGFTVYPREWWHFLLRNEPFPADQESSYFNFLVE